MRKMMTTLFTCLTAIALVTGCSTGSNEAAPNQPTAPAEKPASKEPANPPGPTGEKKYEKAPAMQIDKAKDYQAKISTSMGDITIDLFEKDAPIAVNNFVFLAKDKFYDGITFHRVIKDFMIQTGDPLGSGMGGPGYTFEDELQNGHKYEPGVVAMANSGKNTNGSQFFIGSGPDVTGLDNSPKYTIFGKVTGGMDIVQKIAGTKVKKHPQTGEPSVPEQTITIKSITITEK
ncbi:peptidylprolyl isomerase [Brevibacillus formosus]|uniref:peptidylprolyl isomerase n=1 Tax=Brevibacillus TaxID=55080 RepID=UPI000D0F42DF|nr:MULTISPECIES: peptidylprolyl isomerase [Brevibacillus]MBG9945302.1 peptidylprolyl isomerase [Brevibacillus formosus]MED1943664.1 peptidylprolyl isomerase [Brevibacillus formosus]MED1999964.1 peptidylprolyl isomerase [Brevibacillus formosus]MED2081899.1 peptidylprolyl isomerase [Brevibacillus formosus]PSK19160.1 peptidylprolyl isomerase [Brevibacillus sp. NRRL NRS-603]